MKIQHAAVWLCVAVMAGCSTMPRGSKKHVRKPMTTGGAFNRVESVSVYVSVKEISAARERIDRKDPWTRAKFNAVLAKTGPGLALEVPEQFPYNQENADLYGPAGLYLGVAYRLTGDLRYRDQAKRVLLGMAKGFEPNDEYVLHNSSLDFSVSIPTFVCLFELLNGDLTLGERNYVTAAFALAGEKIKHNAYGGPNDSKAANSDDKKRRSLSNIRSFQNAAVYAIGAAVGRQDFKDWAINEARGGFKAHIEESYDADGLIAEGSAGYQLYDLTASVLTARAAAHSGQDIFAYLASNGNSLKKALDALIGFSQPDLSLVSTGDGGTFSLKEFAALYSLAYSRYKDPVHAYLIGLSYPGPYRPWTTLPEALQVFTTPPGKSKRPHPGPAQYKAGFAFLRQDSSESFYGSASKSRWALLSAQHHTWAHQNANQIDLQLGLGSYALSAHASRGYLEYADQARNSEYVRSRGYNILTLDKAVPLGSASFDADGADARITYCDRRPEKTALIQICEGAMTGGYVKNGREQTRRIVLLAGKTGALHSYVVDWSSMEAKADSHDHRIGWIWHGPVQAVEKKSSLGFVPAQVDSRDPTFRFLTDVRAADAGRKDFTVDWSSGTAGLMTSLMGSDRATLMRLARGPEGAPFLYAERSFARGEPVETAFIAVHEPYQKRPVLRALRLTSNAKAGGVIVVGPDFRDWAVVAYDSSWTAVKTVNPSNGREYLILRGKYAYIRAIGNKLDILGDKVEDIQVKAAGIRHVFYNGKAVRFTAQRGYVRVKP